jgi:hypothetical protein
MPTLEQRLRAVEDKDAIRELTARYCYAVAGNRVGELLELFCEDCEFELGDRVYRGREELRRIYGDPMQEPTPKPFIQNHLIELDGDRARGRCAVEIRVVQKGEAYTAAGYYEDTYRRVGEAWKFASRKYVGFHWVPLSKGWA